MPIVLDRSMALTWCIPEQTNPFALLKFQRVLSEGALVPAIWHMEMANILGLKRRSGNIKQSDFDHAIRLIGRLNIRTDHSAQLLDMTQHLNIMSSIHLSIYDATYVDLALRTGSSIATFDKAMTLAATQHGLEVNPIH